MSNFNKGDKVRRIESTNGLDGAKIGQEATVMEIVPDRYVAVRYENNRGDYRGCELWFFKYTEKIDA